jgi:hypothetical protein
MNKVPAHDLFQLDRSRLRFYYDLYEYRLRISVKGSRMLRHSVAGLELLNDQLEHNITSLDEFDLHWQLYTDTDFKMHGVPPSAYPLLLAIVEFKTEIERLKKPMKLVVGYDTVDIYTNDRAVFAELFDRTHERGVDKQKLEAKYYRAEVRQHWQQGVVYRVNPKHRYRMFLKSTQITPNEKRDFIDFIDFYRLAPSKSLEGCLHSKRITTITWIWDTYYFDFDDDKIISVALLKFDGLIRRVATIEKR